MNLQQVQAGGFQGIVATMLLKAQEAEQTLDARHKPTIHGTGTRALKVADRDTSAADHARLAEVQDRIEAKVEAVQDVVRRAKVGALKPATRKPKVKTAKHTEPFQDSRGCWREANGRMMARERQAATRLFNPGTAKLAEQRAAAWMEAGMSEAGACEQADRDVRAILCGAKEPKDVAAKAIKLTFGKNGMWYYGRCVKGSKGMTEAQVRTLLEM